MLNTLSNMAQHVAVSGDMGGMGGMGYGMGGMRHMAALATPRTTDGSTTPRSGATTPRGAPQTPREETKPVNEIEALDAMISAARRRKDSGLVKKLRTSRKAVAADMEKKGETVPEEETWLEYKFNQLLEAMPDAPVPYDPFAASMNAAMAGGAERDLGADDGTSTTSTKVVTPQGVTKPISPVKI